MLYHATSLDAHLSEPAYLPLEEFQQELQDVISRMDYLEAQLCMQREAENLNVSVENPKDLTGDGSNSKMTHPIFSANIYKNIISLVGF